jgi:hypothetical protein
MRYTAENLRGCLVETMARFRPNPTADALLAAVESRRCCHQHRELAAAHAMENSSCITMTLATRRRPPANWPMPSSASKMG